MKQTLISLTAPRYWPSWLALAVLRIAVLLPYSWQIKLGTGLGIALLILAKRARHTSQINIKLCFPELTPAEQQQLLKASFISMGIGFFETALGWWASTKRLKALVNVQGLEYITTRIQNRQGVIMMGAHFSTLEIVGRLFSLYTPFAVVYRRQKNPVLDLFNQRYLHKHYHKAIAREDIRSIIRCLKEAIPVWYTPDVDAGIKNSVFVPFFGISAASITGTARFAKLGNAVIVPVGFYRRDNGSGYDIIFQPPLADFPSDDLIVDTARVNQIIETAIHKKPAQYLWSYKRFKTRPPGEKRFY